MNYLNHKLLNKNSILPKEIKNRLVVEAATSFGWHKYATEEGKILSIDEFGASGPGNEIFNYFGITAENIKKTLEQM